ncbi:hypothetical protein [Steroidobacter agaridevorans]|uniref:hypothetical protein n=1 Tax=Steroidobacter agaridevorans TaxID=2695856 RepID=UPI0013220AAA|nr:hypothetical protein [Steroidobacter agaridevorans]GFE86019.1 hypothetical protein GCM10011488_09730 [Steroidobacter agaridevorans]
MDMNSADASKFHQLYGVHSPRMAYRRDDFIDYVLMLALCGGLVTVVYGLPSVMSIVGLALCVCLVGTFLLRHGWKLRTPVIVKRPQDVIYMLIYKLRNMTIPYFLAAALLLLENVLIYLTPEWPHHTELMRKIAIGLFYTHFIALTVYRTASLISHLRLKEHVRGFLLQTHWKVALQRQPSVVLEIVHAYFTGLLAHVILIAPWYIVITHVQYSVVFLPIALLANFVIHASFMKVLNRWFYRDHWLGHNSELEFVYLHGPHHDAIPSGLIGVSGNGFLEGFARYTLGGPGIFYNPLLLFVFYSIDVKSDIDGHQFIPGVYPRIPKEFQDINQHSTHHYGNLTPYGVGMNLDQPQLSEELRRKYRFLPQEMQHAIKLDEQLDGFKWDTPRYRRFVELYTKYVTDGDAARDK